jgi:hypothetical protein
MSSTPFLSREEQNLRTTPLNEEIIEKLEKGFRSILETRYGIEIVELEKINDDRYYSLASLDIDYFDDKRIDAVFAEVVFTYSEGDTSDNIDIREAYITASIVEDYSKPDSVEMTFNLSNTSGLAYRIALQAIVDSMQR